MRISPKIEATLALVVGLPLIVGVLIGLAKFFQWFGFKPATAALVGIGVFFFLLFRKVRT